jgi:hypothetical protein
MIPVRPLALLIFLLPSGLLAQPPAQSPVQNQDPGSYLPAPGEPLGRDSMGTRLVNVATPFPVRARRLEVLFMHRFRQSVQDGDAHDLWGMDSGADVGLGVAYGLTPRLDLSFLRSAFQEDFELASKLLLLEQAPRVPMSLGLRVGIDRLEREGVIDPTRPFAQILLARRLRPGVNLLVSPSWVRDTPRLRNAVNVPVGLSFELPGDRLIELEWVPANRDLDGSQDDWHVAISQHLGGHIFELLVGSSRAITVDQILGGDSDSGFKTGDVRLGFNLIRNFDR